MPTYDFLCEGCDDVFEELVLGTEAVECPKCGTTKVSKQVSAGTLGTPSGRSHGVNVPASDSAPPSNQCG